MTVVRPLSPNSGDLLTTDGFPFSIDHDCGAITYVGNELGRPNRRSVSLAGCPLSAYVLQWLEEEGPGLTTATLANTIQGVRTFLEYLVETGITDLSAQAFSEYLKWLKRRPKARGGEGVLVEGTRRNYASEVVEFLAWTPSEGLLTRGDVLEIENRFSRAFRGFKERTRRRVQEISDGVSSEELARLYNAIRIEIEATEQLLDNGSEEEIDAHDPASAVLPFALLMGVPVAGRSVELNVLQIRDLTDVPDNIRMHAPNKPISYVYALPEIQRAWRLALRWQARYRAEFNPDDPALMYPSQNARMAGALLRLDSRRIEHHLSNFYRKCFLTRGADGLPVLFRRDQETGEVIPFDLPYHHYRHASITEYSRYEKDSTKLRIFARHARLSTTLEFYVRNTYSEVREATITTLGPFSERVRLRVQARVAREDEMAGAGERGNLLPGGACGEALEGVQGCRRANDCRICPHFLIDVRLRGWYSEDAARLRQWATETDHATGAIREVQNALGIAAIDEAIVQIIDEYYEQIR